MEHGEKMDEFELYFYSFDIASDYTSLTEALSLVNWKSFHEISMDFLEKHRTALDKVIFAKELHVTEDSTTNFYYMRREEASKLIVEIPSGTKFNRVSDKYLDNIYKQWSLKGYISETSGYNLLKRLVSFNESIGLFDKCGNLLSWCLRDQSGAVSNLQTNASHLRNGFGRAVCSEFARRLANLGDDSYAYVLSDNHKSCKLFESVGFQKTTNLHWMIIKRV
ncbi:uncharacterized protein LOC129776569 isoform X2 [Toxorhynchites rutilus septentrionalis]|uniref:uncharacterized protein LOC129776569 isoform X2 n=1 Tax=Toxorhynchites rutilus septentrionalis TaxID=329112 RepID=UPI0024793B8F|nr:uncharacterized protein LOC129776569 isoform X2 [Toxorhynchites rutilus septentrionalis]